MAVVIFSAIIILSLVLAFLATRGHNVLNVEEFIVGGRSFSGFLLFFLAVGEVYSIGTMVGLPGGVYAEGASYGIWFLGYILLAYPVGYFVAPLIWRAGKRYGAMTPPDLLKSHYESRLLELVAALTLFAFLIPWAQLQFTGLQVALETLGFVVSPVMATVAAAILAFAYIILSGVRSPAFISILKDILVFVAIVIIGVAAASAGGGVTEIFDGAGRVTSSSVTIGGGQTLVFVVTTIIFQAVGFMAITTAYIFTSRSESTVKRTYIVMPLYMLMYPFLIFAAYYAVSASPDLDEPNTALFAAAADLLPPWLIGLVAGAAALSGLLILAAFSLQVGALLSRNLTPNLPATSQRRLTQGTIIVYLLVTAALTILVPTLMLDLIAVAYYFSTQIVVALFGVLFTRRLSAAGLTAGLIAGDAMVILLYFSQTNVVGINLGLIALAVNVIVAVAVSAATKNESSREPVVVSSEVETLHAEKNRT